MPSTLSGIGQTLPAVALHAAVTPLGLRFGSTPWWQELLQECGTDSLSKHAGIAIYFVAAFAVAGLAGMVIMFVVCVLGLIASAASFLYAMITRMAEDSTASSMDAFKEAEHDYELAVPMDFEYRGRGFVVDLNAAQCQTDLTEEVKPRYTVLPKLTYGGRVIRAVDATAFKKRDTGAEPLSPIKGYKNLADMTNFGQDDKTKAGAPPQYTAVKPESMDLGSGWPLQPIFDQIGKMLNLSPEPSLSPSQPPSYNARSSNGSYDQRSPTSYNQASSPMGRSPLSFGSPPASNSQVPIVRRSSSIPHSSPLAHGGSPTPAPRNIPEHWSKAPSLGFIPENVLAPKAPSRSRTSITTDLVFKTPPVSCTCGMNRLFLQHACLTADRQRVVHSMKLHTTCGHENSSFCVILTHDDTIIIIIIIIIVTTANIFLKNGALIHEKSWYGIVSCGMPAA
jgi:hypothetical protein